MADSDKLTAKKAYNEYHNNGLTQTQIGEKYGVSQSYVSQLINGYKEGVSRGKEKGKEEVDPTDFEREQLESALQDKKQSDDEYSCPECGTTYDYMEVENCRECGTTFNWSAL